MYLISGLTPAGPAIAAVLGVALVVSLVLVGRGLRQQWRDGRSRAWLVLLAVGLVVGGAVLAWLIGGWLGEAALVYGGLDGRPGGPTPSSVTGAWPLVRAAASAGIALGSIALLVMLNTAAVRRRRVAHGTR